MDNNLVCRWVFPTIGALTAIYVYNVVFDNMGSEPSPDGVNNTEPGVINREELKQVNEELLTDSNNVKHVDIVKRDVATETSVCLLKESMVAIDQEDYEDIVNCVVNDVSKTITSKSKRWWY